ncbi:ATP-dependent Clp protease ATP-binding subunit [Candidatus Saccharibacteria bacterium]|nr:ATP-dependent Clp protease ATP-binding subunit [Candidatus Saccharibacteria bacterium]
MKPITYSNSTRVRKARFVSYFQDGFAKVIIIIAWILIVAGVCAYLFANIKPASLFVGVGIVGLMFGFWLKWDLSDNPATYNKDISEIALDSLVSNDIVFLINDKQSPRQILSAILDSWQALFIFKRYQLVPAQLTTTLSDELVASQAVWNRAFLIAGQTPVKEISAGVLVVAMILENPKMAEWLGSHGMDIQDIIGGLMWEESLWQRVLKPKDRSQYGGIGRDWSAGFTPVLDQYGQNISLAIVEGNLDFSSVKRGHVLEQMLVNLNKQGRSNLAMVGEVGVGKTALVYSLAEKLIDGKGVLGNLKYRQVVQIDSGMLSAAIGQQASLEAIFNGILNDASRAGNIILYFDEAQLFFGSGSGEVDVASILLPALQSSNISLIASFTLDDWHKLNTVNPSLASLFVRVDIEPSDRDQTISILQDISINLEKKTNAIVTFKALQATYDLSERYLHNKAMPAKAIDLLSDSMNYPIEHYITEESVAKATEMITNTKVNQASAEEKVQLMNLEGLIHKRMINQSRAVQVVSDALRRSRAGVRNTNRPVGSFLFLGPTGVGKTELAKSLAATYFENENSMNRLDMSEYQSNGDVARLLASASKEDVGSSFLQKINQNPFSIVLLDEIEKAHPDILNLLLQMLDEGILTDTAGHKVSFKEAIIICTSNAGANEIRAQITAGKNLEDFEDEFINRLIDQNIFRAELINRFDELVLFRPLTKEELLQVANLIIGSVNEELQGKKVSITLTPAALAHLVELGYDPRLGARPMRRVISRLVENVVAKRLLSGELKPGSQLTLDINDLQGV